MHRIQLFAPRFAVAAALCSASLLIPGTSGVAESGAAPATTEKNQAMHVAKHADIVSKEAQFAAAFPETRISSWQGATSVYGRAFAHGNTAKATAESFRINQVPMLLEGSGVQAEELKPYADFLAHTNTNTIGLMYNQETGQYKFTAIYYTQERSGLEVFGTRMTLLTRNEKNNPLVLADFHVRDMGAFQITDAEKASAKPAASLAAVNAVLGRGATIFKGPRLMVWAGLEEQKVTPTLAYELSGEGGNFLQGTLKARRFVTDAATGAILYQEDLIHDVDVAGNVAGLGTAGIGADTCGGGVASMPIPYARMTAGATTVFTDVNGNYVMPNAGAVPVSITASLTGQYFDLKTCSGTSVPSPQGAPCPTASTLTQSVTPPGPGNFLFNSPDAVLKRAEVNTYVHANKVRDVVVTHHPTFPTISTELNFKTNVNINNSCNAYYSSAQQSINFYIAGGTCTNTSNSTVVHHEYGHRIVNAAGSGQGAYGEGFGDCMAVIVTDQSCLGKGFSSGSSSPPCSPAPADCAGCLRTAANTAQYQAAGCSSCGSAIHSCGMLISGCVWSTRNYLQATHPGTYLDILRDLVVNSVLLHTPSSNTSITPAITVHFLTLDDDDADINNGTPHYNQINAGFTDHNMPGPNLQAFTISATPDTHTICAPATAVSTINIGQVAGQTDPVTLIATGVPAGATVNFSVNPVIPPGSSVMTIGNTGAAATGPATVTVTGSVGQISHSDTVALHISNAAPPTPVLATPTNNATDVSLVPTLTWGAAAQSQNYLVQVATDAGFTNIIYTANTAATTHAMTLALDTLTIYYWRVHASNGCGTSNFSAVFTFRTMDVPPILLVDDDDNSPNVRPYYTAALTALGLTYDIWDTNNNTVAEPTFAQMAPYEIIIWFSGDGFGGTPPKAGPTAASETALAQWFDQGGCLFLSSQDYLYDRLGGTSGTTPNAFMQNYLGLAAPLAHDQNYTAITAGTNVFTGFGPYTLTFTAASGGPGMSNFSDRISVAASALSAFSIAAGPTALTRDGGDHRSIFWAFPMETVPGAVGSAERTALMAKVVGWCGKLNLPCPGDVNNDDVVNVNDLLDVINGWGPCPAPPALCPADCTLDGQVNVNDLLEVINAWGNCP